MFFEVSWSENLHMWCMVYINIEVVRAIEKERDRER